MLLREGKREGGEVVAGMRGEGRCSDDDSDGILSLDGGSFITSSRRATKSYRSEQRTAASRNRLRSPPNEGKFTEEELQVHDKIFAVCGDPPDSFEHRCCCRRHCSNRHSKHEQLQWISKTCSSDRDRYRSAELQSFLEQISWSVSR